MPANTLPSGIHDLFVLAERIDAGLEKHGPWIQVHESAGLAGPLADLREREAAYAVARGRKASAGVRCGAADERLIAWLAKARLVVMLALGSTWSEQWLAAGFSHHGTNIPKRSAARLELSRRVVAFLDRHPEYAVPFAQVTADAARMHTEEMAAAERAVRSAKTTAARCKKLRDAVEARLRDRMHRTILFITAALPKDDPRWLDFGLNQPTRGISRFLRPNASPAEIIDLTSQAPKASAVA